MSVKKVIQQADKAIKNGELKIAWELLKPHANNPNARKRLKWIKAKVQEQKALNALKDEPYIVRKNSGCVGSFVRVIAVSIGGTCLILVLLALFFSNDSTDEPLPTLVSEQATMSREELRLTIEIEDTATAQVTNPQSVQDVNEDSQQSTLDANVETALLSAPVTITDTVINNSVGFETIQVVFSTDEESMFSDAQNILCSLQYELIGTPYSVRLAGEVSDVVRATMKFSNSSIILIDCTRPIGNWRYFADEEYSVPSSFATQTETDDNVIPSDGAIYYVNQSDTAMRSCADLSCEIVRTYQTGATLLVNGREDGGSVPQTDTSTWYVISYSALGSDGTGYIPTGYLSSEFIARPTIAPTPVPPVFNPAPVQPTANVARPATLPRPANCDEAVAWGYTPEQAAQWSHLDRDNDGVACYGD